MATVWLAERADGLLERKVALKLPHAAGARRRSPSAWHASATSSPRSTHPNIARLYDAGLAADGRPYLALEYVDGKPIDALRRDAQALRCASGSRLVVQVARAVAYAHARLVVHRDLKPSNILVDAARPGPPARLRHRPAVDAGRGAAPRPQPDAPRRPRADARLRLARADPRRADRHRVRRLLARRRRLRAARRRAAVPAAAGSRRGRSRRGDRRGSTSAPASRAAPARRCRPARGDLDAILDQGALAPAAADRYATGRCLRPTT